MELYLTLAQQLRVNIWLLENSRKWREGWWDSFEFLWQDKIHYRQPTRLPARIYMDLLLNWIKSEINDEMLFPVEDCTLNGHLYNQIAVPFPANYCERVQTIFRRMFRVYAHIYHRYERIGWNHIALSILFLIHSHNNILVASDCESSFRFSLHHYLHFVNQYNLVSPSDLRPLATLVNELAPQLSSMYCLLKEI